MPGLRIQYFRGPVWGKTHDQLRKMIIQGNNPITGKPVMPEIIEKLTKPLTAEEKKTGTATLDVGPDTYTGTPDELQQLYLDKRYTDFMPIILPTVEKVEEMLKGTSHEPDEIVGRMNPGSEAGDTWSYTVKDVAISAVMAGAKPEYLPVILALASTGTTPVNVSDNGFMAGAVINGAIRQEIGLNYEIGAVGPYAHANTTIGRAWNLVAINGANCGKVGTTYMGTVGNPMNAIDVIIAENEEQSPFEPFAVRRGFKKDENIVTVFMGWGILSAKNWKADVWGPNMNYPQIIKDIYNQQDAMFGTVAVLSPPIADFVRDGGHATVEDFTKWVQADALAAGPMTAFGPAKPEGKPAGEGKPPAGKAPAGKGASKGKGGFGPMAPQFNVVVTGGTNNNYFMMGGMVPAASVQIDKWR
ncbi:MAG: hypothetical protein LBT74_05485 [Acidobacteriota bacterium]|jgi:hypothetical protein|nr:hypothetical protein [Acidobacteriota bacterium]